MKFGLHLSIAGGIENVPKRAHDTGCECFQIFSKSPHGGKRKSDKDDAVNGFLEEQKKYGNFDFYIHTPYYINFASENNRIFYGSVSAVREEMEVADKLGAKGVVTHLGSAKDLGEKEAKEKIIKGLCKVFESPSLKNKDKKEYKKFKSKLLLEITAGSGNIMGDNFEEIAYFIKESEKEIGENILGVCFDTAHAFASGYDLRDKKAVSKTFAEFDKIIGIDRIKLIHLNDSLAKFNSRVDRHANIGEGEISLEGITAILKEKKLSQKNFVLETPTPRNVQDLEKLKNIRDK